MKLYDLHQGAQICKYRILEGLKYLCDQVMSAIVIFLLVTMKATYFFMSIQYHVSSCVAVFGNNLFAIITFIFLVQKQIFIKFGKLDN